MPPKERGRPLKFKSPEDMQVLIDDYFDSITLTKVLTESYQDGTKIVEVNGKKEEIPVIKERPVVNDAGDEVTYKRYFKHPTVNGLAIHLGITRPTLIDYEKKEDFSYTVKSAKAKIEEYVEQELFREKGHTGLIFNLKNNFGWKDTQDVIMNANVKTSKIDGLINSIDQAKK